MSQEYVFRFLTVRPGNQRKKREREPKTVPVYNPEHPTTFSTTLKQLHDAGASQAEILRAVANYQASAGYIKTLASLPLEIEDALRWISAHSAEDVGDLDLDTAIEMLHGKPAAELVGTNEFAVTRERVSDTIVAEAIRPKWEKPRDPLTTARKWIAIIEFAAAGGAILVTHLPLGAAIAELTVIIGDFADLPRRPSDSPGTQPPTGGQPDRDRERAAEQEKLRKKLKELESAHRELSRNAADEDAIVKPQDSAPAEPQRANIEKRLDAIDIDRLNADKLIRVVGDEGLKEARKHVLNSRVLHSGTGIHASDVKLRLKREAIANLSETTRRVADESRINLDQIDPTLAVARIEEEMRLLSLDLDSAVPANDLLMFGGVMLDKTKLKDAILNTGPIFGPPGPPPPAECNYQAGVGDLLMVKQTLKAYELAEFAHVENVLAGEARVREHRRLNVREEIEVQEEERETEKERNLQSTERNEMQAEAEKTVKSQFELEAGLQVSGSYGPSVSFSASLNAGFSTSTEETTRKAVSYSREVTEKTSERVRERVRRELRRRTLEQVEELNRHSVTNEPATNGHIRGIYRWLNKLYDAQIMNYGQRMMFEFVVPEPAAYLLYALIENPPRDNELVQPVAPTYLGQPLRPSHLTRTGYLDYVARYQVRNVPEPPPEFQHIAIFDKQDKVEDGSVFGRATKVDLPAGYRAYGATVGSDYSFTDAPLFRVIVAGTLFDRTPTAGGEYKGIGNRFKEVGIAWQVMNVWSFALAVEIHCQITTEGFAKWQQQVYDAIMQAYLVQKADYEEKLAAMAIQQGAVKVLGRNPLENRRIEREELKKLVISMLTKDIDPARNSYDPFVSEPTIDLARACTNGSFIRFFENAFEWNNIMYVLYPYFWGRHAKWIAALHFTDPDLDFAAFLKAGAARVQVPVRPGFEKAIAYYMQYNVVWEGNDPPLRDDDLYVPIVDEIAENLGKLDEGVPYPEDSEPWEVRIPTSLILVQNLEEIPGIVDTLTGAPVVITN